MNSGRLLALLGAGTMTAFGSFGCGPRADDINTVQPGYVKKDIFKQDSEWYYRRTIAKSETTNQYVVEGEGDIPLERVKWRIEEDTLIAYKPYESIPGTGTQEYEGTTGYEGPVVASFPISSHFDIIRGYDPATGNETNVISENATDRVWNDRGYMRVDWSTDLIAGTAGDNVYEWPPVSWVTTGKYWTDLDTSPTDEFAGRFTDDYVEFSHHAFVAQDVITCLGFAGWSYAVLFNLDRCAFGEAMVRHSFVRIKDKSDFVPKNYPDSIVRKDGSGKAMTDPETGEVLREPIYNRFGIFRRVIPTFDRGYGLTESGRIYRAMIFNIWKRHTDDLGQEIPCNLTDGCAREPKPIIYYTNAEFPTRWEKAAQETAAEYDRVFRGMVEDLIPPLVVNAAPGQQIPDNNPAGASSSVNVQGDLPITHVRVTVDVEHPGAVRAVLTRNGTDYDLGTWVPGATPQVFTVTEVAGQPISGDWTLKVIDSVADTTGTFRNWTLELLKTPVHMYEIRKNSCNVDSVKAFVNNMPDLTYAVARAVCGENEVCDKPLDQIGIGNITKVCTSLEAATRDPDTKVPAFDWQRIGDARYHMLVYLNNPQRSGWGGYGPMHSDSRTGETVSATAYIRGNYYETTASTIVDFVELINDEKPVTDIIYGQDIRRHFAAVGKRGDQMVATRASPAYTSMIQNRLASFGSTREQRLREVDPNHQINRVKRIENTEVEERLTTPEHLAMAGNGAWRMTQPIDEDLYHLASPSGRVMEQNPNSTLRAHARAMLGNAGFCFLEHQLDPHWAGLAYWLKGVPDRAMRYQIVAEKILKHVFLHELGHNVGLAHNFEGTYDALNYADTFWNYYWSSDEEKLFHRIEEHRNTTVMEYVGSKGAFSDYLGKYDEAAIRFAYANQVQVFSSPMVDPALPGGESLRAWRYDNDYETIADHLCNAGYPASSQQGCADVAQRVEVLKQRSWVDFNPDAPPSNEVPFLFCDNRYDGMTPYCSTFDYGSSLNEIFTNYYTRWSNYFFFNNFLRDRLTPFAWSPVAAMYPSIDAMGFVSTVAQYLYYASAINPLYPETPAGQDMLVTVGAGMNMAAEIMSTPEPVRHCGFGDAPKIYLPHFYLNGCDENVDINSEYAFNAEMFQVPLGIGRPLTLGFTPESEDWDYEWVGSYFDKDNLLWTLGWNRPTFLRYSFELDWRTYDIGLYRIFEPEIRDFYDRVINIDTWSNLTGDVRDTATKIGSYWCRADANPDTPTYTGHFEPRRMIDQESTANPSLPGPSTSCTNPGVIFPRMLTNLPFSAMFWAHALFSSDFDSETDLGKSMKVYVVGSYDDFPAWESIPLNERCSVTSITNGLEYRAIRAPAGFPDAACDMIEKADFWQGQYIASRGDDDDKVRMFGWFEKLEYARDLTRIYDQQGIRIPR